MIVNLIMMTEKNTKSKSKSTEMVDVISSLIDRLTVEAKEFSHKFSENELTVSILNKGKNANPSLSKLITRSDDIQINSLRKSLNLATDINKEEKEKYHSLIYQKFHLFHFDNLIESISYMVRCLSSLSLRICSFILLFLFSYYKSKILIEL